MNQRTAQPHADASNVLVLPNRMTKIGAGTAATAVSSGPVGVMLLVSSLEHGGAERQVIELYQSLDRRRFAPIICSLSDYVPLAEQVPSIGADLFIVAKRWKYDVTTVPRLARIVRRRGISLVHAFLFDAEMTARSARRLGLVPVAIASERNSDYSLGRFKTTCLRFTRTWFDAMIANSEAGRRFNSSAFGVDIDRIHVVRNGIDVTRFEPVSRQVFRSAIGVTEDTPLVGMVASFKQQKRHADFFQVARLVLDRFPTARFVCVGEPLQNNQQGAADYHREMRALVDALGLRERIIFAGARGEMPAVYSALDVTVLTSSREGTPNALLESMACSVPVVATSIADNAIIVPDGKVGFLASVGDTATLADRVCRLLADHRERLAMGAAGRRWVVEHFSTAALARHTERVYEVALSARGPSTPPGRPTP
jgi:glycosyltransferase involved in cell wall biosynthesis